jgi:hypothetical protein
VKHDRSLHGRSDAGGRAKRSLSIQQALEWTFRVEKAQLEIPEPETGDGEPRSFGLEYVLIQRAALGTAVDGGHYKLDSYTHPDAEVIAAIVAGLPDHLGGKRMAIRVAELARAGMTPDWLPGAVPRCLPQDVRENQHGIRAATVVVGTERVWSRGKWRTVEVRACPVMWRPYPEQISAARRAYHEWWLALDWAREGLQTVGLLREIEITSAMPKSIPWAHSTP